MKLKLRFLLLMTAIFCSFIIMTWLLSTQLMTSINEKWGSQFAERQLMFDKYRTLSPLIREISLARRMALDPAIIQMALHENDAKSRQKGIAAMESYRFNFRDHSYFAAIASSGNYYFNDAANKFNGKQLRYVLSPVHDSDKWFYATIADDKEYQINLDPDVHLGVTKVWINVLIKSEGKTLGLVGTGIDLTDFLTETVSATQHGVHNMFIDKNMAIQLHDDPKLIDYMSVAKDASQRTKIDKLLVDAEEINQLRIAMQQLEANPSEIRTMWVRFEGKNHLLGLAFLPEVGWYDITLMDTEQFVFLENWFMLPVLFGVVFLLALLAMGQGLHRWVLKPIAALQRSTEKIKHDDFNIDTPLLQGGEIALLASSFSTMAEHVRDANRDLANKVRDRTIELNRITEYEQFRSHILELMTGDAALGKILKAIVQGIEQLRPEMLCSILLLDDEGKHLVNGVAPSLPDFYNAALEGLAIGMGVGSCGTAAFTRKRVIVEDIANHPHWAPYADFAAKAGLGSCWSQPIYAASGKVQGTFAIYHHEVSMPTPSDIAIIEETARLASIAIERKRMEQKMHELAFHDPLTQLPNRRLLNDRLDQTLVACKRSNRYGAIMFLDLDNFKPLNDAYGHEVGDLLLIEVARRIERCIRETDTVARFGGDEFVVMLAELNEEATASIEQAQTIAEKIRAALSLPYQLATSHNTHGENSVEHRCTSSIGVVIFNYAASRENILQQADRTMYEAKSGGRNRVVLNRQLDIPAGATGQTRTLLRLHWHDDYECGEATIDQEHRQLFELCNALIDAAFTRHENPQSFNSALDDLLAHAVKHFADEEAILATKQYADLDAHRHEHKELLGHALQLRDAVAAGGGTVGELVNFLAAELIAKHLLKTDRKFYPLFANSALLK